jgi:hypothetical protein
MVPRKINRISAGLSALIFCLFTAAPLPALLLTDSIYTIPEDGLDISFAEEIHEAGGLCRKENLGVGFGLFSRLSFRMNFDYIHRGLTGGADDTLGDSRLRLWYYLGDFFRERLHCGISLGFTLPTGPDAYAGDRYVPLSLGHNEMFLGFSGKTDMTDHVYLHFSARMTFREGPDESFYSGFHLNMMKTETYSSAMGLNPWNKNAFLYSRRLRDDYLRFSSAVNTDAFSPFIFSSEVSWSVRPYRGSIPTDDVRIEGAGVDPLLLSAGAGYFFQEKSHCGLYLVVNPLWPDDFTRIVLGFEAGMGF